VADLELQLLQVHSAHVEFEYELSALQKCPRGHC